MLSCYPSGGQPYKLFQIYSPGIFKLKPFRFHSGLLGKRVFFGLLLTLENRSLRK